MQDHFRTESECLQEVPGPVTEGHWSGTTRGTRPSNFTWVLLRYGCHAYVLVSMAPAWRDSPGHGYEYVSMAPEIRTIERKYRRFWVTIALSSSRDGSIGIKQSKDPFSHAPIAPPFAWPRHGRALVGYDHWHP